MTNLELIITMLGEATTTIITQQKNSKGVSELRSDAKTGGKLAGRTRKNIEQQIGVSVVSKENFLASNRTTCPKLEKEACKKKNLINKKEIQE